MTTDTVLQYILDGAMIVLALTMVASFIRTVIGPTVTDRLMGVNMINTQVMCCMIILALRLDESYLVDIATIYALLGFLAVVVLTKVYIGVYMERKAHRDERKDEGEAKPAETRSSLEAIETLGERLSVKEAAKAEKEG